VQESPNDQALRQSVRRRLSLDRHLRRARVGVEVKGGVALLRGTVPDELGRALVLYDALAVDGVSRVINQVTVAAAT
jgi:osmotically-inducible protein OsmY